MPPEQTQNSAEQEVVPQEQVQQHVEDSTQTQSHSQEDELKDRNWRQARQKMKEQEAMLKAQQQLIDQLRNGTPAQKTDEPLDESGYLNAGKTRDLISREAEKIAEAKIKQALENNEKSRFHERLKSKYSDFDDVVSQESLALLEEENPDYAETVASISDPYKQGIQVYNYLKSSNLLEKLPSRKRKKEVEQKIKKNESSVASPAQYDQRPMAQAFNMAQEDSSKIYKEMMGYAAMTSGY